MFVAIACYSGGMAYSTNGTNWTPGSMPDWDYWYSCAYEGGMFVALSYDNVAAYSTDGKNWTNSPSGLPDTDGWGYWYAAAGGQPGGYLTNGLVAYWKLNEVAGSTAAGDWSGNGILLPMSNSPTWGSNYLNLVNIPDGINQYGDAGPNALTNVDTHDKTICAWLYYLGSASGSSEEAIVDKDYYYGANSHGGWSFFLVDGQLRWQVESTPDLTNTGLGTIPIGQWASAAVTWSYSNQTASFYINGLLSSTNQNTSASESSSGTADLQVGNLRNNFMNGTYGFNGSMRDVAVYNRILSAAEVASNFFATEPSTTVPYPELLYYILTKTNQSGQTSVPIYLTNSSNPDGPLGIYPSNVSTIWTTGVGGQPNTALHFDGTHSYIDTMISAPFDFTTNLFTINFWVQPTSGYSRCLMQNQDSGGLNGWYVNLGGSYQIIYGTVTNGPPGSSISTGPGALGADNNAWTMVTIVREEPTNTVIYINGLQETNGNVADAASSSGNTLRIGEDYADASHLDGNSWLIQVWSQPLTAASVANLYLAQRQGVASP